MFARTWQKPIIISDEMSLPTEKDVMIVWFTLMNQTCSCSGVVFPKNVVVTLGTLSRASNC